MRNTLFLFYTVLFFFPVLLIASPVWQRKIVNYSHSDYAGSPQNWMITQSDKGRIYVANYSGLLEFDGVRWNNFPIKKDIVRSIKIIGETIYVGGNSEFGYFNANDIGLLVYHSLNKDAYGWGGEVWNILEINDKIYFVSDYNIHIYNPLDDTISKIDSHHKINSSTIYKKSLVVGTSLGVAILNKGEFNYFENTQGIAKSKIVELLPYRDNLLVITARGGVYQLDIQSGELMRFKMSIDQEMSKIQVFSAAISTTKLILGSVQDGVFIVDLDGKENTEHFNIDNGIMNNTILKIYVDHNQNLWLALDNGISFIDIRSNVRPLYSTISPIGTGYCTAFFNDRMYFGTNQGVYTFDEQGDYQLMKGTEGQIWSMINYDESLFCTGDNGLTIITKAGVYSVHIDGVWQIEPVRERRDKMMLGTYSGFSVLKKENGKWKKSHDIDGIYGSIRGFVEDKDPYTFWHVMKDSVITKTTFDSELKQVLNSKEYLLREKMIHHNRYFRNIDNQVLLPSSSGIYAYDRYADDFMHYSSFDNVMDGMVPYHIFQADDMGGVWYATNNVLKLLELSKDNYKKYYIGNIVNVLTDNLNSIFRLDSMTCIIGTNNGFFKIDLGKYEEVYSDFTTSIRKLLTTTDESVLCYDECNIPICIPYDKGSIKIEYGATVFSNDRDIKYVIRMKDKNEEWSTPTYNTSKEYTNLFEGTYTFQVMAIDEGNGLKSNIAEIRFSILPPWYRTPLAYSFYSLIIVIVLYVLYVIVIRKRNRIIKQQQAENIIKDQEINKLQSKNLQDRLYYKTQELSGSILNLVRKNEMLENVKKRAVNISKALDENQDKATVKQKIIRLISQIEENLDKDEDFEVFQSNFDIVHKDFFKLLDEKFPELTRNDKVMCAYLKMNLSSKEIAPLLNISIRGVEISRYRLRKKLNLDREVSLTTYLNSLSEDQYL